MITEDYVSLEVAKLLKEKGFNENVHYEYHYTISRPQFHKKSHNFNGEEYANCETKWFSAPTLQMAMKWLREIYEIDIIIFRHIRGKRTTFYDRIEKRTHLEHQSKCNLYFSYEEACEAAIKYCLENLINKKEGNT